MAKEKGQIDYILLFTILALLLFGVIMIASIGVPKSIELTRPASVDFPTCGVDGVDCYLLLKKHITRVFIALIAFLIAIKIPFNFWKRIAIPFFGVMLAALVAVLFIGHSFSTFANAWLVFNNNSIQPAEIAKLALILYLSVWLERKGRDIQDFHKGFISFCILAGVVILPLILQPDLGSTMIFTIIAVGMYFLAGAQYKHLLAGFLGALIALAIIVPFNDYLKYRFLAYINPDGQNCQISADGRPKDYCWQTEQANIAVASGGWLGKGLTKGVQKSYWLPQASDDFIFAASAEELGFIRILFVVFAFGLIGQRGFLIAKYAPDRFTMFTAVGITLWIVGQAFVNIAVNTGVLPVTGMTLPFISYGGSSLVSVMVGAGILIHISRFTDINYASNSNRGRDSGPRNAKYSLFGGSSD